MAKIVAVEHLTLDGVMQAPARPDEDRRNGFDLGGWAAEGNDPIMQKIIGARMGSAWSLLAGRITYEDLYDFWPKQPPNPMTEALNRVEKFVASTTLTPPLAWQNSTLLRGDILDAVAELKSKYGKTLVIFGSAILVQSLMLRDLIDEFVLQIHPIVLGQGRRLFANQGALARFDLIDSKATTKGVLIATLKLTR